MSRRWHLPLLLFITALLLSAVILLVNPRRVLFNLTGEQDFAKQLYGIIQLPLNALRPRPKLAEDAVVHVTDLPPYGVNTFLEQEVEPEKRARSLEMIADAGFVWIRQSFPWYDIEIHGKGDFEDRRNEPYRSAWDKYDNIVALAEVHDLHIIARLEQPPAWSRAAGTAGGEFGPPDVITDYIDYVSAVVMRYKGRIRFYQIWNEPNIYPEWGHQPVNPAAYTDMLCAAYKSIKVIDPNAVVISGAMAPTVELGTWNASDQGNNLMDVIYLQRMYDAGAGECFDVMAVNDYMLWSGPTDQRRQPGLVSFARLEWVRDVMVANGDAHKPIWISEMNSNAVPENLEARFGRVTLEEQALYAPLAYERIQRDWPWVGVSTMWFFKRAGDGETGQAFYYFRLVEPDFTRMPVYESLKSYITGQVSGDH